MGQTHIFCLLNFLEPKKTVGQQQLCRGTVQVEMPRNWLVGFENRIPGTAVALVAQLGAVLPLA